MLSKGFSHEIEISVCKRFSWAPQYKHWPKKLSTNIQQLWPKKFLNYYLSLMEHKQFKQPKDLFPNARVCTDILTQKLLYEYHILLYE